MGKRKRGRPLREPTDDEVKVIGALTVKGLPREMVANALGISERTFYRWLARGRRARKGAFWQICQNEKKAQAKFVADCMDRIRKVGMGDGDRLPQWTALAWLLERRFPEHFGRRDETAVKGERGGDQPLVIEKGPEVVLPPVGEESKK
jgi:hypothetical protein